MRAHKKKESVNGSQQFEDSTDAVNHITECLDSLEDGQLFNLEVFNNAEGQVTVHFQAQPPTE